MKRGLGPNNNIDLEEAISQWESEHGEGRHWV